MLILRGVVVETNEREWDVNGKQGVTRFAYLRDPGDGGRFAAQQVKLGKDVPTPGAGELVEYRVRLDLKSDRNGQAVLENRVRFERPVQEQAYGYSAVEALHLMDPAGSTSAHALA